MTHIEERLDKLEAQFCRALAVSGFLRDSISSREDQQVKRFIQTGERAPWMTADVFSAAAPVDKELPKEAEVHPNVSLVLELGNKLNEFEKKYNELVNALYGETAVKPADHDEILQTIQRVMSDGSEVLTRRRDNELQVLKAELEVLSLERLGRQKAESRRDAAVEQMDKLVAHFKRIVAALFGSSNPDADMPTILARIDQLKVKERLLSMLRASYQQIGTHDE